MGNKSSSPAPQNNNKPAAQHCEVRAEHQDSHGITPNDASVVAVKGNASGPIAYKGHKPVIFSLNVTLSCSEDGSKRERELGLTRIPVTIADLQDQIQEQFSIPVFDQKLTFGPTVLSGKESLQSYSLRNGDNITVEYSSVSDVEEILGIVSYIQKTLSFFESVEPQLFLFPISPELAAQLRQNIDVSVLDNFTAMYVSSLAIPRKGIINSQLFIKSGGLGFLQQLHSLLLRRPVKSLTIDVQLLEISLNKVLWTLTSSPETEAAVLKELKWENILLSMLRVTVTPNAEILPPRNPYTEQYGNVQVQVLVELLNVTTGCLSCILEYNAPHIQHSLATNQKFIEQIVGAMQSKTVPFRIYHTVISVMVDMAYNLDVHDYLCKPHVIQAIIRTWKNAEPTPENNATPAESVYLKYLAAVLMSLLCVTRQSFSSQYLQVAELLEKFLNECDYKHLHAIEDELGIHWNKYLPYMRVAYLPYNNPRFVLACGSDPRYRALQMMCIETCVLSLQASLCGVSERQRMMKQGFSDYILCLPSVLPIHSRAQKRAKDVVSSLGKEIQLQPPSLATMAKARLAVTHFGLEKILKTPLQELVLEV